LQALESVDGEQAGEVEDQHGDGVALPIHLLIRPDAGEPINEALHRPEEAIQAKRPILIHSSHIGTERLRQSH
jgi:hypothetical protein